MKEAFHIERGIDTFCLCSILSNSQKKGILRYLRKREKFFTTSDSDYWTDKSKYRCNCFEEDGIKLELSNWNRDGNGGWNLFVRIKPALILGLEPWALYRPNKSSYRQLMNRADLLLSTVDVDR